MRMHHPTRRLLAGAVALAAAVTLSACGDDDDDDDASAGSAAFCTAVVAVDSTPEPDVPEDAPPDVQQAALADFAADFGPKLDAAAASAPEDVKADVDTLVRLAKSGFTTGDFSATESPEFKQADTRVDEFMGDNCDYNSLDVTGVDFEFENIPATVEAGPIGVTLKNEGEDLHELVLVRINDGVTQSVDELLALPEEEAQSLVTTVGVSFAGIGETTTKFYDLKPGRYGALCFLPQGTKSFEQIGDGPPHFVEGMKKEFTVS